MALNNDTNCSSFNIFMLSFFKLMVSEKDKPNLKNCGYVWGSRSNAKSFSFPA